MSGHRGGADPAHEISGQREYTHLQRHGQSDRPAEPNQGKRALRVEAPPVAEQVEAAELPVSRNKSDQRAAHDQPGQRAADTAASEAERWQAEMAEDQRPAEQRVKGDSGKAQPQYDARPLERR